jgi:glutamyl-tRNA synthetase
MGYFPEAVVNYLVRLAWSYGDQEIFSREELIEKFTLENVGRSAGVFNPEKFLWVNFHYMKTKSLSELADELVPFIQSKGYSLPPDRQWLEKMIGTLRERARTLTELVDAAHYFLSEQITLDPKAAKQFLTRDIAAPIRSLIGKLSDLSAFSESASEEAFAATLREHGLQMGQLAQPVRVALTGGVTSPGIHEVIAVLGKERTLQRLRNALDAISQLDSSR